MTAMTRREESAMYDLGRQAREADYETYSCNVRCPVKRSWWLAGWHDLDIELGVKRITASRYIEINEAA